MDPRATATADWWLNGNNTPNIDACGFRRANQKARAKQQGQNVKPEIPPLQLTLGEAGPFISKVVRRETVEKHDVRRQAAAMLNHDADKGDRLNSEKEAEQRTTKHDDKDSDANQYHDFFLQHQSDTITDQYRKTSSFILVQTESQNYKSMW